jgi:subtilisin family serine protease
MNQAYQKKIYQCVLAVLLVVFGFSPSAQAAWVPDDPYNNKQWYLGRIKFEHDLSIPEGRRPIIAIIDSGVQTNHPDLAANIWRNEDEIAENGIDDDRNGYTDDVMGWDFLRDVPDPNPKLAKDFIPAEVSHGTIVAGIAAAVSNNNEGISGVANQALIMPLLVLDAKGSGDMRSVIRAIDYAIRNGADIINLSFAGEIYSSELEAALRRAYRAGLLVVAAAGNTAEGDKGRNLDYLPAYPACNDGYYGENMVLGVAATDALDQKAGFSSYGSKCVDISAPGVSIFSTSFYSPRQLGEVAVLDEYYDGYWSGTSMAVPQVSGAAALILSLDVSLSREDLYNILLGGSDYLEKLNPDYVGQLGAGRLNISRSVQLLKERLVARKSRLAIAPASGTSSQVMLADPNGDSVGLISFQGAYRGEVNVASGDLDGDGRDEIILGAGPGGGPQVQIFSSAGKLLGQFFAYDKRFRGGVNVSSGDVNGDGRAEIVTSPGPGGGPHVRSFNGRGELVGQFFAFDQNFRGGANVAVGDLDADGVDEIVCGAGPGGGPQVRVFNRSGDLRRQFFAYASDFRGGIRVTMADLDGGLQKRMEIVTAPASLGSAHVRIFDHEGRLFSQFMAYDSKYRGRTNITAGDIDHDGRAEIISGAGPSGTAHVKAFKADGFLVSSFIVPQFELSGVNLAIFNY